MTPTPRLELMLSRTLKKISTERKPLDHFFVDSAARKQLLGICFAVEHLRDSRN